MKHNLVLFISCFLAACGQTFEYNPERNFEDRQKEILSQFILTEDSAIIELPAGHFQFSKSLILEGKRNVTIKGSGIDRTVLSFKDQQQGAEGIRIANCSNILLTDFTIEDAAGDNIKVTDTQGITIENLKSGWTGVVDKDNGAYALYPVLSTNVTVRNCDIFGASDAGIYVGQSDTVLIENNRTYWNVAGIESENSKEVVIRNNESYENTGGILVFDLPGLTQYGRNIEVYNNYIHDNNTRNFAPPGNMVAVTPPGSGMLILATQGVNIHDNRIENNKTIGIGIISYMILEALGGEDNTGGGGSNEELTGSREKDTNYNPYVGDVMVADNSYQNDHLLPDLGNDFGMLFMFKFQFDRPHVAWDGIKSPEYQLSDGSTNPDYQICINESDDIMVVDLDAWNDFADMRVNPDYFGCN